MSKPRLPTLREIASKESSGLYKKSVVTAAILFMGAAVAIVFSIIWPSYRDLLKFQDEARSALADRNQELVRAAVEQAAGNTVRILGAAENAVQRLTAALSAPPRRARQAMPLEREFYPGGRFVKLLDHRDGYPDGPVTFRLPQIKLRDKSELPALASHWRSFAREAQALHASHPELKWLYTGTPGGNFLVFPASPMIPTEFDPRVRPWYKKTSSAHQLSWITPYYTAGGNDFVLTVAQPLPAHSALPGAIVAVDVTMTDIVDNLLTTPYCDRCVFYLVNKDGEVLGKRGDRAQGDSWRQIPPKRLFRDELAEVLPAAATANVMGALTHVRPTARDVQTSLSRSPKAQLASTKDLSLAVYSAPIESLGWSLVGTVPRGYGGNDGERVLGGVGGITRDLKILMVATTLGMAAALIMFLVAFMKLARAVLKSLAPSLEQFASLEKALAGLKFDDCKNAPAKPLLAGIPSLTQEHDGVVRAIESMQIRLVEEAKDREQKAVYVRLSELGAEVSHPISNALQNINSATHELSRLAIEQKAPPVPRHDHAAASGATHVDPIGTIQNAATRINEELERFRSGYRAASAGAANIAAPEHPRLVLIDRFVDKIVSEFRTGLPAHLHLVAQGFDETPHVWAIVRTVEMHDAFDNVLRNAVEAMDGLPTGTVTITFESQAELVRIKVADNGRGIPPEILPRIFEKNFSHGKDNGTGFGLYQAKQAIEWIEGSIRTESQPGLGATFTIEFPRHPEPAWLARAVELPAGKSLAVIDDDPKILEFWKERMASCGARVALFGSLREAAKHDLSEHVLVLDQEFCEESTTGLRWLAGLARRPTTYLCTAAYEEENVQAEVTRMGLKMIPKPRVSATTIEATS